MKVVALVSGGKDSCYAMMRCIDFGHEVVALANLLPMDDSTDELDSFMYQTVGHQVVVAYAQCMGLPLYRRRIQGMARAQELRYSQTENDEVEDLFCLLREVQNDFPTLGGVSCGAIASDYQRMRVENVCSRLGLVSLAFLWKQEQVDLLQQMIARGIEAVLVKVAAMGLTPHAHLGKDLAEMEPILIHLNILYGINVCGEGGEYETLTLNCPLFKNYRIVLDGFDIVQLSPATIAPVGVLHPSKFFLDPKTLATSTLMQPPPVKEVKGHFENSVMPEKEADACKMTGRHVLSHHKSTLEFFSHVQKHGNFAIYSCRTKSCTHAYGIEEELGFVLHAIEDELKREYLCWGDVLYIHLYIDDMGAFTLANQTYMQIITEKICVRGVPSRSTVGIALLENHSGRIMVEAVAAKGIDKRVLHVQSISCWAPSCIGPYSQATVCHDMLYMAGQLGLDPPTMALVPGGAASEMKQALKNCEAVAQVFSASLVHSSVSILVYVSMTAEIAQKKEAELVLTNFLLSCEQEIDLRVPSVPVIYMQVPALPKGADLEVEPFLYVPSHKDEAPIESLNLKRVRRGECCEGTFISECLLRAFFSVPHKNKHENTCNLKSFSAPDSKLVQFICVELELCLQAFSELLAEASFNWENVLALRVMFASKTVPCELIIEAWKNTVDRVLSSSASISEGNSASLAFASGLRCLEPLFLPVLSTGRDMNMDDLITLDLLAFS